MFSSENIALISIVVPIIIAILGIWIKTILWINSISKIQIIQVVKLDTLWEIYGIEAIREARISGFTESHSRETSSDSWNNLLPKDLNKRITELIKDRIIYLSDYDCAVEVWLIEKDALLNIAELNNNSIKAYLGTLIILARNARGNINDKLD